MNEQKLNSEQMTSDAFPQAYSQCNVMRSLPDILRLDQPYNLGEVLKGLIEAADILLHKKDYDGHGWERLEYCYRYGQEIVKHFEGNDV